MKELLLLQFLWFPSLIGLGWAFFISAARIAKFDREEWSLGELGMGGFVALGVVATGIGFFSALSPWTFVFLLAGYVSFVLYLFKEHSFKKTKKEWIALICLILGITLSAYFSKPVWDMGAYHLPFSKWTYDEPFPLGVGHVNKIMGFQSHWFVVGAALTLPSFGWTSLYIADCLLLGFFLSFLFKYSLERKMESPARFFYLVLWVVLLLSNAPAVTGANGSDFPMAIYSIAAFLAWIAKPEGKKSFTLLFLPLVWSAFALTVKLSAAPVLIGFFTLYLLGYWRKTLVLNRKVIGVQLLLLVALVVPSVIRSVFITGCLAFPMKALCLSQLPWTLAPEITANLDVWVKQLHVSVLYYGLTSEYLHHFKTDWLPNFFGDLVVRCSLFSVLLGLGLLLVKKNSVNSLDADFLRRLRSSFFILLGCLIFWFLMAPSPRFGHAYILALGSGVLGYACLRRMEYRLIPKIGLVALLLLVPLWGKRIWMLSKSETIQWTRPSLIPEQEVIRKESVNGTPYIIPTRYAECWDLPNPCSREEAPNTVMERLPSGRWYFHENKK